MRFVVDIDDDDAEVVRAQVAYVLHGVVGANRWLMRTLGRRIPRLYSSGVRYQLEPEPDKFQLASNLREILERRWTECKGAAAWRLAELKEAAPNEDAARAYDFDIRARDLVDAEGRPARLFHVRIVHPNGRIEDPSARLKR